MNRQVAFAYATAGVAASLAAIVLVGSAFGFGVAPAAEETWADPATTESSTDDYEAQQAAYERPHGRRKLAVKRLAPGCLPVFLIRATRDGDGSFASPRSQGLAPDGVGDR